MRRLLSLTWFALALATTACLNSVPGDEPPPAPKGRISGDLQGGPWLQAQLSQLLTLGEELTETVNQGRTRPDLRQTPWWKERAARTLENICSTAHSLLSPEGHIARELTEALQVGQQAGATLCAARELFDRFTAGEDLAAPELGQQIDGATTRIADTLDVLLGQPRGTRHR